MLLRCSVCGAQSSRREGCARRGRCLGPQAACQHVGACEHAGAGRICPIGLGQARVTWMVLLLRGPKAGPDQVTEARLSPGALRALGVPQEDSCEAEKALLAL